MASRRGVVIDWIEQGHLAPEALPEALAVAGVTPDAAAWRRFIATLLVSLGALLVAAGVIFFFAYNWQGLGRFQKFALVEVLFVVAAGGAWHYGPATMAGRAALLLAALLTGSILALIGQTYQTGADAWQLFAWWAGLIVAWVAVARMAALWLLLVALVNIALTQYFQTFPGLFGVVLGEEFTGWILFSVNGVALVSWEATARRGAAWMHGRWVARLLAVATGMAISTLTVAALIDSMEPLRFVVYGLWLATTYVVYRRRVVDVFMLAGGVLSAIVVATVAIARLLPDAEGPVALLSIGVVIIGASAAGARWLRRVSAESEQ